MRNPFDAFPRRAERVAAHDVIHLRGHLTVHEYDPRSGRYLGIGAEADNLITTLGKNALFHLFGNDGIIAQGAQYIACGTGAGSPAVGDTALFTELARVVLSTVAVTTNQVQLQGFFSSNIAIATWTEAGVFGNGATGTSGSGQLFTHALMSYVHPNTKDAILSYVISLV
jgi:hypothetical protein